MVFIGKLGMLGGCTMKSLLALATLAALALAENFELEGADTDLSVNIGEVKQRWVPFAFGGNGTFCRPFNFILTQPAILKITDYCCSGDQFLISDNGVPLGTTSMPIFDKCDSYTKNPDDAYNGRAWSSAEFRLLPGFHRIRIKVIRCPFKSGFGAIRILPLPPAVTEERPNYKTTKKSDLVYVKVQVPRCQADAVCHSMGLELANININNFMDASDLAFQCGGANSQAWIDDWNGDKYRGTCLALNTGAASPGGSINVPECCSMKMPVICQKRVRLQPRAEYSCDDCQRSCYCTSSGSCQACTRGLCQKADTCQMY